MKRLLCMWVAGLCMAPPAAAGTFTELGQGLHDRANTAVNLHGGLRLRGELLGNLDLDRGPTPSGQLLFPTSLSDPKAQVLGHADMRLRSDLDIFAPRGAVAIHLRIDVLDNVGLGGRPAGPPMATLGQEAGEGSVRVRRVWAETLTPFGVLAAGRMGSHWGLGMMTHGGDGMDADSGDAADRVAFVTPIAGLVWALAFDWSATGPSTPRKAPGRTLDLDPRDDVRTLTFAVLRYNNEATFDRRSRVGRSTFDAGLWLSLRSQEVDVPAGYLPLAATTPVGPTQVVPRGFSARAGDLWLRWRGPRFRLEAEAAVLQAEVAQVTLIPGALVRGAVESLQLGAALQSEFGHPDAGLGGGLDFGYASGDPAPGFGADQPVATGFPKAGDLDGPQADPPRDRRIDNFRFHSDYRIDRILFREIIGRVTDTLYVRPHVHWRLPDFAAGALEWDLAAVASWAEQATSPPGGARPLAVEIDPTVRYRSADGLLVSLEGALLLPLAGLDNPQLDLDARPAWLLRLALQWQF